MCLQVAIENAPEGSWRIAFFTALTQGEDQCCAPFQKQQQGIQPCLGVQSCAGMLPGSRPSVQMIQCSGVNHSVLHLLHAATCSARLLFGGASDVRCDCAGPLKPTLLSYYALTSDHVQRLQGVRANGKFSSTAATSDTPMSKPEDLKSIVADARVSSQAQM